MLAVMRAWVNDSTVPDSKKGKARGMIANPPTQPIAEQEELFRFQIYLNSERASMFFAEKILLVEGATEKVLLDYLFRKDWSNWIKFRVAVVDTLGKYNTHRFMALLDALGLSYGVIVDDDQNNNEHAAINSLIQSKAKCICPHGPEMLNGNLELFLGLSLPGRDDRKPVEILKVASAGGIDATKLNLLREKVAEQLDISIAAAP